MPSKNIIYDHFNKLEDYSNLKIGHIELIKDLKIKEDEVHCENFYQLLVKMMRNAYEKWSDVQREIIKRSYE